MIISRVVLDNYGLYGGLNDFDLRPRVRYGKVRPIILFGGKNGAGKTTLLDAIRLALYGRQALGPRITERAYHDVLASRIHRQKNELVSPRFAKVGVEFEFVTNGEKNQFYVERSWLRSSADTIDEFVRIDKDGKRLEEVGLDHWESFVADVIPERLSQLFFFDGEKIKLIAEDITGNEAICRSIQNLLGIDLVERLKADLSIFSSRVARAEDPEGFDRDASEVESRLNSLDAEINEIEQNQLPALRTEKEGLQNVVTRLESTLRERGGAFAENRDKNIGKRGEIEVALASLQRDAREECERALPFVFCPTIGKKLIKELELESRQRKAKALLSEIVALRRSIRSAISRAKDKSVRRVRQTVNAVVDECFESFRNQFQSKDRSEAVHKLSDDGSGYVVDVLTKQAPTSCQRVIEHIRGIEKTERQLHKMNRMLQDTPKEESLESAFTELADANQRLGAVNQRMEQLQHGAVALANQRAIAYRQKQRILERLAERTAAGEKLAVVKKIMPALDTYRERLTKLKISSLEAAVFECFNRLARKSDFIRSLHIDPMTFAVHVKDRHGKEIPKEELSSGEKQMFAISMLWGLARTSGRALPVVIDTPLARLDSDHRKNLIEHYFPHASQQVILLSTDTEVDQSLFDVLSPHISHCYHLRYDELSENTVCEERYFWKAKKVA